MSTTLVIVEKHTMAKKYREALQKEPNIKITVSNGHLEGLADIESYLKDKLPEKFYWQDTLKHLPYFPQEYIHHITKADSFQEIAKHLPDATEIILACDPDREGELIHRNIIEIARKKRLVKTDNITRMWIHSETKEGLLKAFRERKSYKEYEGYYQAARTREIIDWLIGIQLTILYSVKYSKPGKPLSVGRVQSWLLAEICKRYIENKNHVSKPFWTYIFKTKDGVPFNLVTKEGTIRRITEETEANQLTAKLNHKPLTIASVDQKPFTEYAPTLYDLKQLQKDAATKYKFTPDETLQIAQSLYEQYELISYPRTDCNVLSTEEAAELPKAVALIERFPQYKDLAAKVRAANPTIGLNKKYIGELQGHYAIIPVLNYSKAGFPTLPDKEAKLFDLIVKRLLAALLPPCKGSNTLMQGTIEGETFSARFKNFTELGYKTLLGKDLVTDEDEAEEEKPLQVAYQTGQSIAGQLTTKADKTKPEPLFNDKGILILMERAHLQIKDKALREALVTAEGIGTAATRASFIPLLMKRDYITKEKNVYIPTEIGLNLYEILPEELKVPDFSAQLEYNLAAFIKNNSSSGFEKNLAATKSFMEKVFAKIGTTEKAFNMDAADSLGDCPKCGKSVIEKEKGYFCVNRDCGFAIWKEIAGGKITKTELKNLLKTGETKKPLSMTSKVGNPFEARLRINKDTWKLDFIFDDKPTTPTAQRAPTRDAPTIPPSNTSGGALSEKQMAVIERNAPETIKIAVQNGDYAAGRKFLDEYFKKK